MPRRRTHKSLGDERAILNGWLEETGPYIDLRDDAHEGLNVLRQLPEHDALRAVALQPLDRPRQDR